MTVYLLLDCVAYSSPELLGVYASEEEAKLAVEGFELDGEYNIVPAELGAAPSRQSLNF